MSGTSTACRTCWFAPLCSFHDPKRRCVTHCCPCAVRKVHRAASLGWLPQELVEHALATIRDVAADKDVVRILDVGCGSGAISLALLASLPNAVAFAVDVSPAAVELTRDNAAVQGLDGRLAVKQGTVLDVRRASWRPPCHPALETDAPGSASPACVFDIIVSNPPYIPSAQVPTLEPEVRLHEDVGALDGGVSGLDVVDEILDACAASRCSPETAPLLPPGGSVWLELDETHPAMLQRHVDARHPGVFVVSAMPCDLFGHPRFAEVQLRGQPRCHMRG